VDAVKKERGRTKETPKGHKRKKGVRGRVTVNQVCKPTPNAVSEEKHAGAFQPPRRAVTGELDEGPKNWMHRGLNGKTKN
jgi:hypothetical protein